jgi:hypothetical protein
MFSETIIIHYVMLLHSFLNFIFLSSHDAYHRYNVSCPESAPFITTPSFIWAILKFISSLCTACYYHILIQNDASSSDRIKYNNVCSRVHSSRKNCQQNLKTAYGSSFGTLLRSCMCLFVEVKLSLCLISTTPMKTYPALN